MIGLSSLKRAFFVVDAGGSHTRLSLAADGGVSVDCMLPSINPSSVGESSAHETLAGLAAEIKRAVNSVGDRVLLSGLVASAAVSLATLPRWKRAMLAVIKEKGLAGSLLLTNDVVPLLVGSPLAGCGAVMVAGTGSCVLGGAPGSPVVHVGGVEYIGSDEGSAFHLGRLGLVAAIRDFDGRGAKTAIRERIERAASMSVEVFARYLAELPHPRVHVAHLAPEVTKAWLEDSDRVAGDVVRTAVDELGLMARRAMELLPGYAGENWVITGGVIAGCPSYAELVREVIVREIGHIVEISVARDCREAGMSALKTDSAEKLLRSFANWESAGPWSVVEF